MYRFIGSLHQKKLGRKSIQPVYVLEYQTHVCTRVSCKQVTLSVNEVRSFRIWLFENSIAGHLPDVNRLLTFTLVSFNGLVAVQNDAASRHRTLLDNNERATPGDKTASSICYLKAMTIM